MTMWIACAKSRLACVRRVEMLGIVRQGDAHDSAFTWEIAVRALCVKEKTVIVHTPLRDD
jgi:hypothetical protein